MIIFFLLSFVLIIINIDKLNCYISDKNNIEHKSSNNECDEEIIEKQFLFESFKYHNNNIFWNMPRNNNNFYTLLTFQKNKTEAEPWPNKDYNNYDDNINVCKPFLSVISFEFDDDNNIYILDEGSSDCSSKLYKFNLDGDLDNYKIYDILRNINDNNILFNDLTIDTNNNYGYILCTDLLSSNSQYHSLKIISIDFSRNNVQNVSIQIKLDDNYSILDYLNNSNNTFYKNMISISLSCDGESLFISPLNSRKIYSISTQKIQENEQNIYINEAYKNDATSSLVISNLGNLYFPGIEEKVIYIAGQIDNDLARFDYRSMDKIDLSSVIKNNTFISKIFLNKGKLYLTTKQYINKTSYESDFIIKNINDENDYENSYAYKCIGMAYKYNWASLVVWIIFAAIVLMIIVFVIVENKQDMDNNKKTN